MNRKEAIKSITTSTATLALSGTLFSKNSNKNQTINYQLKNNINHAACRWCYNKIPMLEFLGVAKDIGLKGIDLLKPDEWQMAIDQGMTCSMSMAGLGIQQGFNDPSLHETLFKSYEKVIPEAAGLGIKNIICFSGNRNGLSDEQGMINCAHGLKPVVKLAEKYSITIMMELLNSKVNHPDYQCDSTLWGVALCEMVGSENFKLLYDIYHMQIMEGDVIATIQKYSDYIGHYHTGGVPGRHEIDDTQELYYPAIMKAIVDTGFKGYVAQEFVPSWEDPLKALRQSVQICDV